MNKNILYFIESI